MRRLRFGPGYDPDKNFFICLIAAVLLLTVIPCHADVLFVHDYKITEYLLGEKDAELAAGYTDQAMFVDKQTRYIGSWMKRFFGKVEEKRETTHFLLGQGRIQEIDWYRGRVVVFPFEKFTDVGWMKQQTQGLRETEEFLKARYQVTRPQLTIRSLPEKKTISDIPCSHVEAKLRLETIDIKKKASSITLVHQDLWVSDAVPGFEEYKRFHAALAQKMGLDAARMGSLSFLLRYWEGSLDPIRESLKSVSGYPVSSTLTVDGQYIKDMDSDAAKTHSFQIKEEFMQLREVRLDKLDASRFKAPADFQIVTSSP
ncbi:MAG: hypothetical protein B6245_22305 [Desulfobacteraceae bacterium 4572_88]|nr:MAG: hypothetical protein B6245_22305 [Desulfobacteraceae bacterium 4572_88]